MKMRIALSLFCAYFLTACVVTHGRPAHGQQRQGCQPAHHLENGRCVHNGNARGHDDDHGNRGRGRGHD